MKGRIYNFFTDDHRRLESVLETAEINPGIYNEEMYAQFRTGLLKHIKMEETILFPALRASHSEKAAALIAQLRLDHGALTSLMVPPPSSSVIRAVKYILERHNVLEEQSNGMYDLCEELSDDIKAGLLNKLEMTTEVPVLPHRLDTYILGAVQRALAKAGYNFQDFED